MDLGKPPGDLGPLADELAELAKMDAEPWQARITRSGRWTWDIDPVKGLMGLREGYIVIGTEARAERVARRKLAKLRRDDERAANSRVIR